MKKIVFAILVFLIPIFIQADYSITNYRIDIVVLENGDLNIKEAFSMSGSYNGFERIIDYKGNYNGYYGSKIISVNDVSLYDAKGITLNEIRSIDFSNDFENILVNSNLFTKVNNANKGEYGVYTVSKKNNGKIYTIYNPSKINKDFYINYTLSDMVIVHKDIIELAMNVFTKMNENIEYLEIYIHIPNNSELLKVWVHGQSNSISEIVDKQTIKITTNNLKNNYPFDFRIVFDKEAVLEANKKSNEIVLNKIIEIEEKLQDETNIKKDEEYELLKEETYNAVLEVEKTYSKADYEYAMESVKQLRDDDFKTELLVKLMNVESKVERKYIIIKVTFTSIMGIIIIGLLITFYQIYKKYDKENVTFKGKYFKDIPINYLPSTVGYLLRRKINNNDLSASILNLINNKNISFEQTKNKKDYKFVKVLCDNLSNSNDRLIKLIFDDSDEITLSKLKKRAKIDCNKFLSQYSNWFNSVIQEATSENFYEDLLFPRIFGISYSILGIVISALLLDKQTYFSPVITILICILAILYFTLFYKRTIKGNEQYSKWVALKKFMIDFNNIDEKELPEIKLWDKYLMYAVTLGCFDKLSKNMQLKIDKLTDNVSDVVSFQFFINYIKIIDSSIKDIISIASSVRNN